MPINPEVYRTLELGAPYLIGWVSIFVVVTIIKLLRHARGQAVATAREGMIASELPGLPLMLMHSAGFGLALWHRDVVSALLFAWWGPGYVLVASMLLLKVKVDWRRWALATSWGCKLSYVLFIGIYASLGLWGLPFVFSAWIVNDQVRLTWLRGNADRARRVVEDYWLFRILYVALLLLPLVVETPLRPLAAGVGLLLLALWLVGLKKVVASGRYRVQPDPHASDNLRDIVYLRGARVESPAA
jgi:hypothetical protein